MTKRFFMYDEDAGGMSFYETEAEALAAAEKAVDDYRDNSDETWPEGVMSVNVGTISHKASKREIGGNDDVEYTIEPLTA